MPVSVMRKLCSPGIDDRPRTLTAWTLRTTELRSRTCDSQKNAVGNGEDGILQLGLNVFTDQEGGDFPRCQVKRQPLDELLQSHRVRAAGVP